MAKSKRQAVKSGGRLFPKAPNTDGKPKVPRYTAADVAPCFEISRGEVAASMAKVVKARELLNEWFQENMNSTDTGDETRTLQAARARFLRHGVPNLMRHLETRADYVHSKCKEMAAEHGRGAVLFRVDRLAHANESVVLDWVTAEEMKEIDYETYWAVHSHNQDKEFAAVFVFRQPNVGRTNKRFFVSRIFDVAKCLKAAAGRTVPSRSWVRLDHKDRPFAPLCIGHHCKVKMVDGANVRVCGKCKDAVFCSAVCGVTSHECGKVAGLRRAIDKAILVHHAMDVGEGPVPVRCLHRWNVSMDKTLAVT
eukprot:jgi/Mesvir1/14596/Mv05267-RA.1